VGHKEFGNPLTRDCTIAVNNPILKKKNHKKGLAEWLKQ
jgi:hypothetical protein